MPIFISTSCLNNRNLGEVLEAYTRNGIRNIEIGPAHEYVKQPIDLVKSYQAEFNVHSYFPPPKKTIVMNLASQNKDLLGKSLNQIKKSVRFCKAINARLFTFHPGFKIDPQERKAAPEGELDDTLDFYYDQKIPLIPYEEAFATLVNSVSEICDYARKLGVRIAVENLGSVSKDKYLMMCESQEFKRLFSAVSYDKFGMLLDLGHLKLASIARNFDRYDFIDSVRDYVFELHVHDNNGQIDEHRALDETSWCFEVIGRKCFTNLPIVLESTKLTINQIVHQVSLIDKILSKRRA